MIEDGLIKQILLEMERSWRKEVYRFEEYGQAPNNQYRKTIDNKFLIPIMSRLIHDALFYPTPDHSSLIELIVIATDEPRWTTNFAPLPKDFEILLNDLLKAAKSLDPNVMKICKTVEVRSKMRKVFPLA